MDTFANCLALLETTILMFRVLSAHELTPDDRDMVLQITHNLATILYTLRHVKDEKKVNSST